MGQKAEISSESSERPIKRIYLADVEDKAYVRSIFGNNFITVNKLEIKKRIPTDSVEDMNVYWFMLNDEISKELKRTLNNKKQENVIYVMDDPIPIKVKENIKIHILPHVKPHIDVHFGIITHSDGTEEAIRERLALETGISDIYVRRDIV